jgi:hypothetical protein
MVIFVPINFCCVSTVSLPQRMDNWVHRLLQTDRQQFRYLAAGKRHLYFGFSRNAVAIDGD